MTVHRIFNSTRPHFSNIILSDPIKAKLCLISKSLDFDLHLRKIKEAKHKVPSRHEATEE